MKLWQKASSFVRTLLLSNRMGWAGTFGGGSNAGELVSVTTALNLSTVWACVGLISEAIATLPCAVYEIMPDKSLREDPTHELYSILHDSPNADMSCVDYWTVFVASLLLWGNAFSRIDRTSRGRVIALTPLLPDRMFVYRDPGGAIMFRYTDPLTGRQTVYTENDIWHVKGFTLDGLIGIGTIAIARHSLGLALATEKTASKFYANGMRTSGFIQVPGVLTEPDREKMRARMAEFSSADNAGRAMLLEGGMTYTAGGIPPDDAELLSSRGFNVEEICRWFRTPPVLVGHNEKTTSFGAGIENLFIGFGMFTLTPHVKRIEMGGQRKLLSPADRRKYAIRFDMDELMRSDSAGRAKFLSIMVQNALMSRNEGRVKLRMPRSEEPNADKLTAQSNLVPIDMLGKITPQHAPNNGGDPNGGDPNAGDGGGNNGNGN